MASITIGLRDIRFLENEPFVEDHWWPCLRDSEHVLTYDMPYADRVKEWGSSAEPDVFGLGDLLVALREELNMAHKRLGYLTERATSTEQRLQALEREHNALKYSHELLISKLSSFIGSE